MTIHTMTEPCPTKYPINLLRGWPAPAVLPAAQLSTAAFSVLSQPDIYTPALQYGPDPGFEPLRKELANWHGSLFNMKPDSERICITGGASQNLACVLQSFTDPNYTRNIWVVAPCYFLACPIFEDAGFADRLKAVPEDSDGVDVEYLEAQLKVANEKAVDKAPFKVPGPHRKLYRYVIYIVPTSGNPSGKTLPLSRRQALVALARKYDALIIADDVYDLLQWPLTNDSTKTPFQALSSFQLPRLVDIDLAMGQSPDDPGAFGYAISNGSFSKISGPGCRTGWVEAAPAFAYGISQTGSTRSGGAPSQMSSALLWEMLRTGSLKKHIEQVTIPSLQRRHALLSTAVKKHLYPYGVTMLESSRRDIDVYGGYFLWLTLDPKYPARTVTERARVEENLILGFGGLFEVSGDEASARFNDKIRLCFSWEPENAILEAILRFERILKTWDSYDASTSDAKTMGDWQ